jgi:hypothetical protein
LVGYQLVLYSFKIALYLHKCSSLHFYPLFWTIDGFHSEYISNFINRYMSLHNIRFTQLLNFLNFTTTCYFTLHRNQFTIYVVRLLLSLATFYNYMTSSSFYPSVFSTLLISTPSCYPLFLSISSTVVQFCR